jgi:hypothetical protein
MPPELSCTLPVKGRKKLQSLYNIGSCFAFSTTKVRISAKSAAKKRAVPTFFITFAAVFSIA